MSETTEQEPEQGGSVLLLIIGIGVLFFSVYVMFA